MQGKDNIKFYDHLEKDSSFSKQDLDAIWQKSSGFKQDWTPDSNAAFAKFKANVMETETEAIQTTLPRAKSTSWYALRIAASIALLIVAVTVWNSSQSNDLDGRAIASATHTQQELMLIDGSVVQLNKGTQLLYDQDMSTARKVSLKGEAFFDIERNPDLPFVIETNDATVKVLGTSFNVRAIDGENTEVEVATGLVEVTASTGEKILLNPFEKATISANGQITKTKVAGLNSLAWYNGKFSFDNTPLSEVAIYLNRTYDKAIELPTHLQNCHITMNMSTKNIDALLKNITLAIGIDYQIEGDRIVFSGEGC